MATPATVAAYAADHTVRRVVERLVHLVLHRSANIARLLLAEAHPPMSEAAHYEVFGRLHQAAIIGDDLQLRFADEYSTLGHRIMRHSDELDHAAVWRAARQLVPDGRALLAALAARSDAQDRA